MAGKEGESQRQLTTQPKAQELRGSSESTAGNQIAPLIDQEILEKLKHTPKGEDKAFWPIRVLNELEYYISVRSDPLAGSLTCAIGEKYAPFQESIRKVKTAYAILAHPHCKHEGWKEEIGRQLETDRQLFGQDQVALNTQEIKILTQITTARKIPLDPEKRVYSYSEVPIAPWIDPYGRRRMTTQEIREQLNPEAKKQTVFPPTDKQRPNPAGKPSA